jgi:hypothetical protein
LKISCFYLPSNDFVTSDYSSEFNPYGSHKVGSSHTFAEYISQGDISSKQSASSNLFLKALYVLYIVGLNNSLFSTIMFWAFNYNSGFDF